MLLVPSQHIFDKIIQDQSSKRLMENNLRGVFAEYLIVDILGSDWSICDGSWNEWDIDGPNDTRLEIKSTAYIQSWYEWSIQEGRSGISIPRFDIAERKSTNGVSRRAADLYVFALHSEKNAELADHRKLEQWNFYVIKSALLPKGQKSIGLRGLERFSIPVKPLKLLTEVNSKIENWVR